MLRCQLSENFSGGLRMSSVWDLRCRLTKLLVLALLGMAGLLIYVSLGKLRNGSVEPKDQLAGIHMFERKSVELGDGFRQFDAVSAPDEVHAIETAEMKSFQPKIVYNRVGKCGSRSMLTLMGKLASKNKFTLFQSPVSNHSQVPVKDLVRIAKRVENLPSPSIYSRHVHYIDFAKYGINLPIYINLIRDPIERFSSHYHFLRYGDNKKANARSYSISEEERKMDINDCILRNHKLCSAQKLFYIIPYFCGQDIMCQTPSEDSLYRAKMHVLENYFVVGYLEDFDGLVEILESLLPRYFEGVSELWKQTSSKTVQDTSTIKKRYINETARAVLKERLREEYDFYNFVRLRFKLLKKQINLTDY